MAFRTPAAHSHKTKPGAGLCRWQARPRDQKSAQTPGCRPLDLGSVALPAPMAAMETGRVTGVSYINWRGAGRFGKWALFFTTILWNVVTSVSLVLMKPLSLQAESLHSVGHTLILKKTLFLHNSADSDRNIR